MRFTHLLASATLVLASSAAFAQTSQTINVTSRASIVRNLSVTNVAGSPLDFGFISASAAAGTVTINPTTNARTAAAGATLVGSTFSAASFTVTGSPNVPYTITFGAPGNLTRVSGTETMALSALTHNSTSVLNGTGTETFRVGGQLAVGATQAEGQYTGTFALTVAYN